MGLSAGEGPKPEPVCRRTTDGYPDQWRLLVKQTGRTAVSYRFLLSGVVWSERDSSATTAAMEIFKGRPLSHA